MLAGGDYDYGPYRLTLIDDLLIVARHSGGGCAVGRTQLRPVVPRQLGGSSPCRECDIPWPLGHVWRAS